MMTGHSKAEAKMQQWAPTKSPHCAEKVQKGAQSSILAVLFLLSLKIGLINSDKQHFSKQRRLLV
jgi:hypothetical protein